MKPLDRFIEQMLESARLVRTHDVGSATEVIQKALQDAGLAPQSGQGAAPFTAPFTTPFAEPFATAEAPAGFVDINAAPDWSEQAASPRPAQAKARRTRPAGFRMPEGFRMPAGFTMPGAAPGPVAPDPAAPGDFLDGSFTCAAGTRRYKLYVPAGEAAGPRPLVVMLHGCTQHAADFAAGTTMNAVAERQGCLVLYPEQDRAANPNNCWNWFEPGHQARDGGEAAILAGMTRQVAAQYGADAGRIYVAGLSAGGAMAAILGAAYPDLYAAVGVHSGLAAGCAKDMITGLKAMKQPRRGAKLGKPVPVIVFHGDGDGVVHPANGEGVLRQFVDAHGGALREHGEQRHDGGRAVTRTRWHDGEGTGVAEHWVLHGAAHAWAGGSASGSHTDTTGPNASEEMLRFFLAAPRRG